MDGALRFERSTKWEVVEGRQNERLEAERLDTQEVLCVNTVERQTIEQTKNLILIPTEKDS
jgi:hypothetical protein